MAIEAGHIITAKDVNDAFDLKADKGHKHLIGDIWNLFNELQNVAVKNHNHTISNITDFPTIPAAQIQADWNQTTATALDFIKNKPTIPTLPISIASLASPSFTGTPTCPTPALP